MNKRRTTCAVYEVFWRLLVNEHAAMVRSRRLVTRPLSRDVCGKKLPFGAGRQLGRGFTGLFGCFLLLLLWRCGLLPLFLLLNLCYRRISLIGIWAAAAGAGTLVVWPLPFSGHFFPHLGLKQGGGYKLGKEAQSAVLWRYCVEKVRNTQKGKEEIKSLYSDAASEKWILNDVIIWVIKHW